MDSIENNNNNLKSTPKEETNLLLHLAIRLGVPFIILFPIIESISNAREEKAMFLVWTSTILLFLYIVFLIIETSRFSTKKKVLLKNTNLILLLFFAFLFLISAFVTHFFGGYN
ncbi:hypothetical protein [Flavobacterium poyangense]|uniref:hypothetical protein n=1 Tax=Flavobacterium poyangense TaxID=2204302 RepID=UPI001422D795|nr:hypothetical protein [Flavobacterium sp. JXAS1]